MVNWLNKNIKWLIALIFTLIFLIITKDLIKNTLYSVDDFAYSKISLLISPFWTFFFKNITYFASTIMVIIISLIVILIIKNKKYSFFIVLNLINTVLLNQGLKLMFSRPRPNIASIIKVSGYSYPSGHAMMAMSFYGLFVYLMWKSGIKDNIKKITTVLLSLLILLIGLSRVYLGVHYSSDVIAGYSLSIVYLIIYTSIISKYLKEGVSAMRKERKTIITSVNYALQGITAAFKSERNMNIHFCIMFIIIIMGILFKINTYEWIICIVLFGLVISAEIINTSIESTIDLYTEKIHPKAKLAKDTAAGAVLILAITSAIVGLIIFLPKIYALIF